MTNNCMQCGRCTAACPAAKKMDILPHAWVMKAQVQNLNCIEESESIWLCMMCYCCAERCPRGVKPFEIAQQARAFVSRTSHSSKNTEYDLQNLQTSPSNPIPQQLLVAAARKRG